MNKIILLFLLLLIMATLLSFSSTKITALESKNKILNISSFTKAVCEDNYCQDYLFECDKNTITSISPITGAAIQFNNKWMDPRTKKQINKTC